MLYGLNDISLVPARTSRINSRNGCNPYNADNMLPLFTAPMNSIINETNYNTFLDNKINTIIPRGVDYSKRWELSTKTFIAVGFEEFQTFIEDFKKVFSTTDDIRYVCVDVANGHMQKLITLCTVAKNTFGYRLALMTGNIANPETYLDYAKAGIDFVRIGIGSGSCCTTSSQVAIHYSMASLIIKTAEYQRKVKATIIGSNYLEDNLSNCSIGGSPVIENPYRSVPFIIADGGFNSYDKIIKALALGANFVMIGKLFAQCKEACGEIKSTVGNYTQLRVYYGMSTKKAQIENSNKELKTEEGIETIIPILYSIKEWSEDFISYLRSAMSYTDSFNLSEFKNAIYDIISPSEYQLFYK